MVGSAGSAVRPVLQQLYRFGWGYLVASHMVKDLLNIRMRSLFASLACIFLHRLENIFADVMQCDRVTLLPLGNKRRGIRGSAASLVDLSCLLISTIPIL